MTRPARISILWLFIIVFMLASAVQGQQSTSEPSPTRPSEVLYFWQTEVLFPEAVSFNLVIERPDDGIASVRLIIEPPGQDAIQIPVNVEAAAITTGDFVELVYIWEIPRANPIPVFAEVPYSWRVITTNDVIAEVDDRFVFTDRRSEWTRNDDENGRLNFLYPGSSVNPAALRNSVDKVYDLLADVLGIRPRFDIALYPESLELSTCVTSENGESVLIEPKTETVLPCDVGMAEAAYEAAGYTVLQLPSARFGGDAQVALTEFLTQQFYNTAWSGKVVPEWFEVGLMQFFLPSAKNDFLAAARTAARSDQLFTLRAMETMPANKSQAELWQAQSYGMVVYIANEIGVSGLYDLASGIADTETFAQAYQAVMGNPLESLLPAWRNWIFRDAAASAYNYTPYLPETPTPAPTLTNTPFPPTPTYTPTYTPTFTPTPTVTGFHTATPLATNTPAPTRRPPTATLTPRPAGSLIDTPTPVPVVVQTAPQGIDSTVALVVIGMIFLILVVLVFMYLRVSRR